HGQNGFPGGFPGGFGGGSGDGSGNGSDGSGRGDGTGGRHERGSGAAPGTNGGFPGAQDPEGRGPGAQDPEGPGGMGGGMGGLLEGAKVSDEAASLLEENADQYTWAAATTGSQNAASYQLATGKPVMALGGFNGTDPSLSLAGFQKYVEDGKVHWFIAGGSHRGFGGASGEGGEGGQENDSARIEAWVTGHFTAKTVGGTTFYDLTAPKS
ncbi:glycosyl transferase, partial [Streptomyces sp. FH025]|nr:glycosyl transferase [Streptomyces sp. FH025]